MSYSKQQLAFFRKLYLCHLIHADRHNVPSLAKLTGMPRRTIQDSLKVMGDIGIDIAFEQDHGQRYNTGYYQIRDWGPIQAEWVRTKFNQLAEALKLPVLEKINTATPNTTDNTTSKEYNTEPEHNPELV